VWRVPVLLAVIPCTARARVAAVALTPARSVVDRRRSEVHHYGLNCGMHKTTTAPISKPRRAAPHVNPQGSASLCPCVLTANIYGCAGQPFGIVHSLRPLGRCGTAKQDATGRCSSQSGVPAPRC
jgi:hypothetical protein